jgi:trk system potassium uptake protein TrkA
MRILIIGAGNTGRALASKLCAMDHDVVVVDRCADQLAALDAQFDIMTVQGSGSSSDVLEQAGLAKADLLVAVTCSDEVNILACQFAHAVGVAHKVSRVSNPEWTHSSLLDFKALGVDLMISQSEQMADQLFGILRNPGLLESVDLLDGRLQIAGVSVVEGSQLLRGPVAGFQSEDIVSRVRFVAMMRDESLSLPRGDTQFKAGDDVYAAMRPEDLPAFLDWVYPGRKPFDKAVVTGGSDLGLDLARRMEAASMPVVLLEQDAERASACSDVLHKTLILQGDASDRDTLVNAGVSENSAFVAITADDELNIISCILANRLESAFTVALVAKPDYVPLIRSLGLLDRVVNPHLCMVNAIMHYVRGKHVKAAVQLHRAPGELLHVAVREGHRWVGKTVRKVRMPGACILAGLLRGDDVLIPTGDLGIEAGDQLVIFALPADVERVQSAFRS